MNNYVFVMAGGKGERFWPRSRLNHPKYLLPVIGSSPMLVQTVDRLSGVVPEESIFIITNKKHIQQIYKLCPNIPINNIIAEPEYRDTAASISIALAIVKYRYGRGCCIILPADHIIYDKKKFKKNLLISCIASKSSNRLIVIGIKPYSPATNYGYIRKGDRISNPSSFSVYSVKSFTEKPEFNKANKYFHSGEYYWNSGIFTWTTESMELLFRNYSKMHYDFIENVVINLRKRKNMKAILRFIYPKLNKISIDYAVMEKVDRMAMIVASFRWDDVGEWTTISKYYNRDMKNNKTKGRVILINSSNNIATNEEKHSTVLIGVSDLVIVQTKDVTMICAKNNLKDIKKFVCRLSSDPNTIDLV